MPLIIAALWGAFYMMVGSLVGRVLVSLGIGVIVYTGTTQTLGWLKSSAVTAAAGLPSDVLAMMARMRVGERWWLAWSYLA